MHDGLTAKTGAESQPSGHIEPVQLIVIRFGKVLFTLHNDDVAGGAGTTPAACVFQMKVEIKCNVQY